MVQLQVDNIEMHWEGKAGMAEHCGTGIPDTGIPNAGMQDAKHRMPSAGSRVLGVHRGRGRTARHAFLRDEANCVAVSGYLAIDYERFGVMAAADARRGGPARCA